VPRDDLVYHLRCTHPFSPGAKKTGGPRGSRFIGRLSLLPKTATWMMTDRVPERLGGGKFPCLAKWLVIAKWGWGVVPGLHPNGG
jgi:hypothetical protein